MVCNMDEQIFDKIEDVDLKKKMEDSYIDYAMSVIAASTAGCQGRFKTCTKACALFDD